MTTKQERTPGPWHVDDYTECILSDECPEDGGDVICKKPNVGPSDYRWSENASRIVHCVNNFDELVGALEEADLINGKLCQAVDLTRFDIGELNGWMNRARAALKLAKGNGE